jgi:CheY-like chemotaxis protein
MTREKPLILVVEDEPLLRLNATDVLEEAGYSVTEANNAETALELLEVRRDVQVLFTDIHMPGAFNGLELARRVHRRWPHVLLMITSGRERPRASDIPEDGRFLAKPYRHAELVGRVNELLRGAQGVHHTGDTPSDFPVPNNTAANRRFGQPAPLACSFEHKSCTGSPSSHEMLREALLVAFQQF